MLTIVILVVCAIVSVFVGANVLGQRRDYNRYCRKGESYRQFCDRYYSRYF